MPLEDRMTTPPELDEEVASLLRLLAVDARRTRYLPFTAPTRFKPEVRECHINAWLQMQYEETGSIESGWLVWQHKPSNTVEAHFHSVWLSPTGETCDVTPREDGEVTVLFAPDPDRRVRLTDYDGRPALKTYTHVTMVAGKVRAPLRDAIAILITDLIYEHGLATRSTAA